MFSKEGYTLEKSNIKRFILKGSSNCIKAYLNREGVRSGWEVFLNLADRNDFQVNNINLVSMTIANQQKHSNKFVNGLTNHGIKGADAN